LCGHYFIQGYLMSQLINTTRRFHQHYEILIEISYFVIVGIIVGVVHTDYAGLCICR